MFWRKKPQFIVTLTSYGARLEQSAPQTVQSILGGEERPDRLLLWLAQDEPLPPELAALQAQGLEICRCPDLKSYKKLVPALQEYPKDILITADDDLLYQRSWLASLKASYYTNRQAIHVHRAHEIVLTPAGRPAPYASWIHSIQSTSQPQRIFPTTGGGVLYPPGSLDERACQQDCFLRVAPKGDDVWFWAMAHLANSRFKLIGDTNRWIEVIANDVEGLWEQNQQLGGNDYWIDRVLAEFPQVLTRLQ